MKELELNITGLLCGYLAVLFGQICVLSYHYCRINRIGVKELHIIQPNGTNKNKDNSLLLNIQQFIAAPEGFLVLIMYLAIAWIFKLLPATYYSFQGTEIQNVCLRFLFFLIKYIYYVTTGNINWFGVFAQLLMVDGFMYIQHLCEHKIRFINIYISKHYLHHETTNPILFDAFKGNIFDTMYMIIIPLHLTTICCPSELFVCNVWTYMTFGALYAAFLLLIHCEYSHPWDSFFQSIGFATPSFHHTHHIYNNYNYGHLFEYYDRLFQTYKNPIYVKRINQQTC